MIATSQPAAPALGAEATNTHIEALRVAAFAKFKPEYFWDGVVRETELAGTKWRIIASADIEDAEDTHFIDVVGKWTLSAETIIPPVDRTQILDLGSHDEISLSEASDSCCGGHAGEPAIDISRVRRVLVPKRKGKDPLLTEDVVVSRLPSGVYARFVPIVSDPAGIPFYYPNVHEYAFGYVEPEGEDGHCASTLVILVRELSPDSAVATAKQQAIWRDLIKRLFKWTATERFGYQKRVTLDVMVDYETYTSKYQELKARHSPYWVANWPEQTDARKFVYEDIAIASWIICLWEQSGTGRRQTFADLGCGNGLLVHLLAAEGYVGYGIDQCSRKVWSHYGQATDLRAQTLEPYSFVASVDWIIGNHADELVPWIPVIAAQSEASRPNFVVIPCCPHDFSGRKMTFTTAAGQSKYHAYAAYICDVAKRCGFEVEREYLRIPSTKNLALVGRRRAADVSQAEIDHMVQAGRQEFVARVPDSVKNELRRAKAQARKQAPTAAQQHLND
ncbi:tRNA(Ser) Um(44) 2'-O-methyltransferase [Coemansia thaxteri]|uniref:tRNA (uracil-O(2)-)-methyltransferase n=1 Tax=Coemansia thaxteri TaxID=2663907 RepID=A0A9W8BCP4_9FUNG|nr:tRNA(Ser) Um(44) 2'-O-methyltransferase [Coemansia thaxteri]KAJ2003592.1 tRNA(Ser) Um(44) 2'-O-methyltransferase [Coemansia thaxteri]KAJ2468275.1 tRNA(Ser) Um(44) 2'-O-methyltransferase [Coemansia sp. RSA 2322]KAJ2486149.1 tRNA(Ser) Um(44) 2'-O-methyltransferase [Coemansia sp. RSA 2320]